MSPSLLSSRLKWLAAEGVVERQTTQRAGPRYALTEAGKEFVPLVEALGIWGQRWTRRELQEHEIDLGLLVWSIESSANSAAFGERRCLVRLELTDQVATKRLWWFLNQNRHCQLCVDDPGGGVNLYLACTLLDAIRVIRGDLSPAAAIGSLRLEVIGDKWARDGLVDWLNLSALTKIAPRRRDD